MNNKDYLINDAEHLYVYKLKNIDTIARELNLNRKTVMNWKEQFDWDTRRRQYTQSKTAFHEELYEFARKIMKDITIDMESGEKVDPGRFYAFCRLLPMFGKVKSYEDVIAMSKAKPVKKGLTAEMVARIEEEILGIPQNNNENNDENRNQKEQNRNHITRFLSGRLSRPPIRLFFFLLHHLFSFFAVTNVPSQSTPR